MDSSAGSRGTKGRGGKAWRLEAHRFRHRLYDVLVDSPTGDTLGRAASLFIGALIVLNTGAQALALVPELTVDVSHYMTWLKRGAIALFSIEYLLRLWASTSWGDQDRR